MRATTKHLLTHLALLCAISTSAIAGPTLQGPVTSGYYPSWGGYGNYLPNQIPAKNLDIVNYAFGDITPDCSIDTEKEKELHDKNFKALETLKNENPHLKILYSIGGENQITAKKFSVCAAYLDKRKKLAEAIKSFLATHPVFSGVDLDWETPTSEQEYKNYAALVNQIGETIGATADDSKSKYYITIALAPGEVTAIKYAQMKEHLDFINLMAYNYHGAWERATNNMAALYHNSNARNPNKDGSDTVDYTVQSAIKNGVIPSNKLIMGIAFHGPAWNDATPDPTDGTAANVLYRNATPIDPNKECLDYKCIFAKYDLKKYTRWVGESSAAIYYDPETKKLLSFDNAKSMNAKAQYIKNNNLLGAMYWELSKDVCGADSLAYQMRSSLGKEGAVYPCAKSRGLQLSNLQSSKFGVDEVVVANGGAWYSFKSYMKPGEQTVYTAEQSENIKQLMDKVGLQVLVKFASGQQLWCNANGKGATWQGEADLKFNFDRHTNIMVRTYDDAGTYRLACDYGQWQ